MGMRTQRDILRSGDHVPSWPPHWTPRTNLLSIGLIEKLFSVSTSTDRDLKRFSFSPMLQCLIPSMMAGSSRYHIPESSIKLIFRETLQWHWQAGFSRGACLTDLAAQRLACIFSFLVTPAEWCALRAMLSEGGHKSGYHCCRHDTATSQATARQLQSIADPLNIDTPPKL
jgi:hypothetical protein